MFRGSRLGVRATSSERVLESTMALRQRKVQSHVETEPPVLSPVLETFKSLDAYPKTLDDFKERTSSGAAVSIVSCSVIALLVLSELRAYFTPVTTDHLYVDTTRGQRIRININVSFPSMPCAGLNLVAMDVAGEQQIDVVNNIVKTRWSLDGRTNLGPLLDDEQVRRRLGRSCGPCFAHLDKAKQAAAAQIASDRCCNACSDVKSLFNSLDKELGLKWELHPLCQHEAVMLDPARLETIHEGCNLFGHLEVNKVAGNFHVAPGKAFQSSQGQLVHEFKPFDTHKYNISHVIHSLSFGVHYPSRVNPLDGATAVLRNGSGVFQYFAKVVPTTYVYADGKTIESCQYSVTDQFKSAHDPSKGFVLPGVFIIYDISPIMVKFTEKRPSFTYFLTSLCAIVGGVFTVAGIVDSVLYNFGRSGGELGT